jgi:hypothetical protein
LVLQGGQVEEEGGHLRRRQNSGDARVEQRRRLRVETTGENDPATLGYVLRDRDVQRHVCS